jgi:hypothetical protein
MNDAYYNQLPDMHILFHDLEVDELEYKMLQEIKEKARLFAESKMEVYGIWDRKDGLYIAIFYNHMIDFLFENYIIKRK